MGEISDWEEGLLRNVPQESAQAQAMSRGEQGNTQGPERKSQGGWRVRRESITSYGRLRFHGQCYTQRK